MIQRIQTLFLLAAVILGIVLFFTPVATLTESSVSHQLFMTGIQDSGLWYLQVLFVPCFAIPFIQIFLFKNRKRQLTIGKISVAYWLLWTTFFFLVCYFGIIENTMSCQIDPAFGAILPLIAISFIVMANKAIKKDDDLVRSIDRIR